MVDTQVGIQAAPNPSRWGKTKAFAQTHLTLGGIARNLKTGVGYAVGLPFAIVGGTASGAVGAVGGVVAPIKSPLKKVGKAGLWVTGIAAGGALIANLIGGKKSSTHREVEAPAYDGLANVEAAVAAAGPADGRSPEYWRNIARPGAAQNVAAQPEMNVVDPATVQNLGTGPTRA